MRNAGASFKVTKIPLTRLALKGTKFEHLSDLFKGPTGSPIPTTRSRPRALRSFADDNDKFIVPAAVRRTGSGCVGCHGARQATFA